MKKLRYVPFARVDAYLRLGWQVVLPQGQHPSFDAYRVLMVWRCECSMVEPL